MELSMGSHYDLLQVNPRATAAEIRAAYKQLVNKYHPDQYAGHPLEDLASRRLSELNEAYRILSDPKLRARYDATQLGASDRRLVKDGGPHDIVTRWVRLLGGVLAALILLRYSGLLLRAVVWLASFGRGIPLLFTVLMGSVIYFISKRRR